MVSPEATPAGDDAELARLYRPLDQSDRQWMEALGCMWPDETTETDWLANINRAVVLGNETQRHGPNPGGDNAYRARQTFVDALPVLKRIIVPKQDYFSTVSNVIGTLRLLHERGVTDSRALGRHCSLPPENLLEKEHFLASHGISGFRAVLHNPNNSMFTLSKEHLDDKLRFIRSIVRAWGYDTEIYDTHVAPILERTSILSASTSKLRTLARLSIEQFGHLQEDQINATAVLCLTIPRLETSVAAYLEHGAVVRSIRRFDVHARTLDKYSTEELRAFLATHPHDPVVKTYFRGFPLSEAEREQFAQFDDIPRWRQVAWASEEEMGPDGYRILTAAPSFRSVIQSLKRMPKLDAATQDELLQAIAAGLDMEEQGIDPFLQSPEQQDIIANGLAARRQLVASYAARVIGRHPQAITHWNDGEVAAELVQRDFVVLAEATLDYARRKPDARPAFWSFAERRLRERPRKQSQSDDQPSSDPV